MLKQVKTFTVAQAWRFMMDLGKNCFKIFFYWVYILFCGVFSHLSWPFFSFHGVLRDHKIWSSEDKWTFWQMWCIFQFQYLNILIDKDVFLPKKFKMGFISWLILKKLFQYVQYDQIISAVRPWGHPVCLILLACEANLMIVNNVWLKSLKS